MLPKSNYQPLLLLVGLAQLGHASAQGPGHFYFNWPTSTTQCGLIDLTWSNAIPPFTAFIIPIFAQPFVYNIPNSAYSNGQGRYRIQVQLPQGAYYTMFMNDAQGFGSGGSAEIQIVRASNFTSCLDTASANRSTQAFSFTAAGRAQQCSSGFDLQWTGARDQEPYNISVIPLDQGFYPYNVKLDGGDGWDDNWEVNMTTGTRFTVMMNDKQGYGRGGVGGVYEVTNSTKTSCIVQSPQQTGIWPAGLATNLLPVPSSPTTSPGSGSKLSGGAIAGIVIGVLAFFAIIGLMVWFLLRRKRKRENGIRKFKRHSGAYPVDLGPGPGESQDDDDDDDAGNSNGRMGNGNGYGDGNGVGMVEPYRHIALTDTPAPPNPRATSNGDGSGGLLLGPGPGGHSPDWEGGSGSEGVTPEGTNTPGRLSINNRSSAGFAGLGAGMGTAVGVGNGNGAVAGDGEGDAAGADGLRGSGEGGIGMAGPLPAKRHPQPSSTNHMPNAPPIHHQGGNSQMRVVNPENQSSLPALPPGAGAGAGFGIGIGGNQGDFGGRPAGTGSITGGPRRRSDNENDLYEHNNPNRTFRRHEDAGRVRIVGGGGAGGRQEEVVDLPPLYTDIRRDDEDLR